jgi:hypothetical protein
MNNPPSPPHFAVLRGAHQGREGGHRQLRGRAVRGQHHAYRGDQGESEEASHPHRQLHHQAAERRGDESQLIG